MSDSPCLSKNIYLADDDEDDRLFFNQALKEVCNGSELTALEDGERLMAILSSDPATKPDVLFLDINMPGKNGYDCLKEMKTYAHLEQIPVVVFTTSEAAHSVKTAYDYGASHFITKPSDFGQLKRMLKKVLNIDWRARHQSATWDDFVIAVA